MVCSCQNPFIPLDPSFAEAGKILVVGMRFGVRLAVFPSAIHLIARTIKKYGRVLDVQVWPFDNVFKM